MLRADQDALLRWVLDALDANDAYNTDLADRLAGLGATWSTERFALAGLATGLTATIGALAEALGLAVAAEWANHVDDQRVEVAARHARFAALLPVVLGRLAEVGLTAVPVKGAVLMTGAWPFPAARPMADIDVLVAPTHRERARATMVAAGFRQVATEAWEDTFLGWGDGGAGRRDGESREHNGKIEVHPGWVERLHGYVVDDGPVLLARAGPGELAGAPCHRLSDGAFAAHVLGHLGACAIRGEVRAVNVVDAVVLLRTLDAAGRAELHELAELLDPRPFAAGSWLVARYRSDVFVDELEAARRAATTRLPERARRALGGAVPADLLRDPAARTTFGWRRAWAMHRHEVAAVARQYVWPAPGDLVVARGESVGAARVRRFGRAAVAGAREAGRRVVAVPATRRP